MNGRHHVERAILWCDPRSLFAYGGLMHGAPWFTNSNLVQPCKFGAVQVDVLRTAVVRQSSKGPNVTPSALLSAGCNLWWALRVEPTVLWREVSGSPRRHTYSTCLCSYAPKQRICNTTSSWFISTAPFGHSSTAARMSKIRVELLCFMAFTVGVRQAQGVGCIWHF